MNEIVNKFLLPGDKFMPQMHLRQPGFIYSACGPFIYKKQRKNTVENHSQDHEKLSFHTYMELVYVNIRTCIRACLVHWTSLCKY